MLLSRSRLVDGLRIVPLQGAKLLRSGTDLAGGLVGGRLGNGGPKKRAKRNVAETICLFISESCIVRSSNPISVFTVYVYQSMTDSSKPPSSSQKRYNLFSRSFSPSIPPFLPSPFAFPIFYRYLLVPIKTRSLCSHCSHVELLGTRG